VRFGKMKKVILFWVMIALLTCIVNAQCGIVTTSITLSEDIYFNISGINNACFVISGNDIVIDGNGHSIIGRFNVSTNYADSKNIAIDISHANNIVIKNLRIEGFFDGIRIHDASGTTISDNRFIDSVQGIWWQHGSNNLIINNVFENYNNPPSAITILKAQSGDSENFVIKGNSFTINSPGALSQAILHSGPKGGVIESNIIIFGNNKGRIKPRGIYFSGDNMVVQSNEITISGSNNDNSADTGCGICAVSGVGLNTIKSNKITASGTNIAGLKAYRTGIQTLSVNSAPNFYSDNEIDAKDGATGILLQNAAYSRFSDEKITSQNDYITIKGKEVIEEGTVGYEKTPYKNIFPSISNTFSDVMLDSRMLISIDSAKDVSIALDNDQPEYPATAVPFDNALIVQAYSPDSSLDYRTGYEMPDGITAEKIRLYEYPETINKWILVPTSVFEQDVMKSGEIDLNQGRYHFNIITNMDVPDTNTSQCLPDCTKGDNIAYLECESDTGCLDVQMDFQDPSGNTIADCDKKLINESYNFLAPYCIGNSVYRNYHCSRDPAQARAAIRISPIDEICPAVCIDGICTSGESNNTVPEKNETTPPENETEVPAGGECPSGKTLLCHNGKNEICVGDPSVIAAHIKHGDIEGRCIAEKAQTIEIKMNTENRVNIEFNNSVKVSFRALKDRQDQKIAITARSREAPPENIPAPERKVKKYLVIEHPDIDNSEIADSKLEFTVDDEWMKASSAKKDDVILSKFVADKWKDLRTSYVRSEGNLHYFEADSEGFSTFAVTLNNTVAAPQQETVPAQEPQETEETLPEKKDDGLANKILSLPFIIGASIFIVLLLVKLNLPQKQKNQEKTNPDEEKYRPVLNYIEKLKKKGISKEEISKDLEDAGHDKATIERLLKFSFSEK
jgi:PGF-pre-PGF domain-containing protein